MRLRRHHRVGGGRPFQPGDLAGAVLGLRADAAYVTTSGSPPRISLWADQSPQGHDATQGTAASQPEWVASVPALRGRPAARWDAVTRYMDLPLSLGTALYVGQPATVFWVGSGNGADSVFRSLLGIANSGFTGRRNWRKTNSGEQQLQNTGTLSKFATGSTNIGSAYHYGVMTDTTAVGNLRLDGAPDGPADQDTVTSPAGVAAVATLGATENLAGGTIVGEWRGDIAEIWAWDRVLTASEIAAIEQYARRHYGL